MRPPHRFRTEVAVSLLANDLQLAATAYYLHHCVEETLHNLKPGLGLLVCIPRVSNPLLAPARFDPSVGLAVLQPGS